MSLGSSRTRLMGALKELQVRWDRAKSTWDDPQSRDFESRHLVPLEPTIRHAVTAMEKMEAILARARRECE